MSTDSNKSKSAKSKIVALLKIQGGKIDQFYKLTDDLIENSRNEAGVITYKLFKSAESDNEVLFFEEYTNEEAMQQHGQSEHFKQFMEAVQPLLAEEPQMEMF